MTDQTIESQLKNSRESIPPDQASDDSPFSLSFESNETESEEVEKDDGGDSPENRSITSDDFESNQGSNTDNQSQFNNSTTNTSLCSSLRKRKLMKKAPDAPKRFKSAYICFVTEKMDDAKKSLPPDMKVTEVMKTLASLWKNLPPLERMKYEKIAEEDKSRYFEEMSQYSGPLQVPNKRQKKPAGAPKRAISAFLSYSQVMRPQIRSMHPELKNTDISSVLAQKWHSAQEEEKRPHIEREIREREKYHEEMAQWKEDEDKRQQQENETTTRQQQQQQQLPQSSRNTIDFLDLPSSSIWESLDHEGEGRGEEGISSATEKEMTALWEDASGNPHNHRYPFPFHHIHQGVDSLNSFGSLTNSKSSSGHHNKPREGSGRRVKEESKSLRNDPSSFSASSSSSLTTSQNTSNNGSSNSGNNSNNSLFMSSSSSRHQKASHNSSKNNDVGKTPSRDNKLRKSGSNNNNNQSNGSNNNSNRVSGVIAPPPVPLFFAPPTAAPVVVPSSSATACSSLSSSSYYPDPQFQQQPRYYSIPVAMPEGQMPSSYPVVYPSEYFLPPSSSVASSGSSNSNSSGGGGGYYTADGSIVAGYPHYSYPIHPGYAFHPPPLPPPIEGGPGGYWQWKKYPSPSHPSSSAGAGESGANDREGSTDSHNDAKEAAISVEPVDLPPSSSSVSSVTTAFLAAPPPPQYVYDLNYLQYLAYQQQLQQQVQQQQQQQRISYPSSTTNISRGGGVENSNTKKSRKSSGSVSNSSNHRMRGERTGFKGITTGSSHHPQPAYLVTQAIPAPLQMMNPNMIQIAYSTPIHTTSTATAAATATTTGPATNTAATETRQFNPLDNVVQTLQAVHRSGVSEQK